MKQLKENQIIHGFRVRYSQPIPEIDAVMYRMEHEKNGADLIWLARPDENKTFCIGFKTIPEDDTGVFHILEHSVLNGSEKYPLREPFVELIKSSMATFLNAMTYPDKTVYPVSSRNPKDFLNLMDVYLDAVINPLSIKDPHAFRQEGWHFELDSRDGELRRNGVVYNEMKGAFASNEEVMSSELGLGLFPDNCYKYVSGGHPDRITDLTYENYLASHARFYHPSNSRIVLDGDLDIEAALEKIDSFIGGYDRIEPNADIPMQKAVTSEERIAKYEIGSNEDDSNKAIIAGGWVYGDYSETEKIWAFSVLADALCETNDSPLTKAILDSGLAEDVVLYNYDGVQQPFANLVIKNCDPEKRDEIWKIVYDVLKDLAENGLDHKLLSGILSRREFIVREKDYGYMPKGLVYALTTYETWLYGGDPAQNLTIGERFESLRKKIDTGWFEQFIREVFLDNPHRATVCLLPSKTLGEEKKERERSICEKIKSSWDDLRIEKCIDEFKALRLRQETPDSREMIERLPKLKLSDIGKAPEFTKQDISEMSGVTVMHESLPTDGIVYLNMYFSLSDFSNEELTEASLLAKLLTNIPTKNYSAVSLSGILQANLGRFETDVTAYSRPGDVTSCKPWFIVRTAALESKKGEIAGLLDEILNKSDFSDFGFIYNLIRQIKLGMEQAISMRGNSFASRRALASFTSRDAALESIGGITMLRFLQSSDVGFKECGEALCGRLKALCKKIFTKSRLKISITGAMDKELIESTVNILSDGKMGEPAVYKTLEKTSEGFTIPAQIGFAAIAGNVFKSSGNYSGVAKVAAQILTYDYLWNDVRVKGGAYGVNMSPAPDGDVAFSSYRDPSPSRSLGSFRACPEVLKKFVQNGESAEKYIISTIANNEPLLTPRAEGELAARRYLCGISRSDVEKEREEILSTTSKSLSEYADVVENLLNDAKVCVIGEKNLTEACGVEKIEAVQLEADQGAAES